jgi:hypothetical protein
MSRTLNTPLSFLTVGEFLELLKGIEKHKEVPPQQKVYEYGLIGLANTLGCSKATAWKVKKSGLLDEAIIQRGRKIIVDKHLAIKLYKNVKN